MMRDGDEEMGFSITVETGDVRIRGWGFWSAEMCQRFAEAVWRELGTTVKLAGLRVDVKELKPMRDEGQRVWSDALVTMAGKGIGIAVLSEPPPLTKLQFIRLCKSAGVSIQYV